MEELLSSLIHLMLARQASDAHFVLKEGRLHFQLRCLGKMDDQDDGIFDAKLFQYLKYVSHLDLGDLARPQSGNLTRVYHGKKLQFRFSLLCTNEIQTGVLRLLNQHSFKTLEEICSDPQQQKVLLSLCQGRQGLSLFSGPTGSGKTTTLHVLLRTAALCCQKQVITLEDPIEIQDSNYVQLQINEKSGLTYETGIEQLLRHDPDVIMIGEIRSSATARMALRAALSGHSVFTTVHANTCSEVLTRLLEFGVEQHEMRQIVSFVSTQRLVMKADREGRMCLYEMLYGDDLNDYFQRGHLPKSHRTMKQQLLNAFHQGYIAEEGLLDEVSYE